VFLSLTGHVAEDENKEEVLDSKAKRKRGKKSE
jgi:hypothetical protein